MERILRPGELFRDTHGSLYQLVTIAEHAETGERLVIYQSLNKNYQVYALPWDAFWEKMEPDSGTSPEIGETVLLKQTEDKGESAELSGSSEESAKLNPLLLEFVEEEDYGARLDIFRKMKGSLTQEELDVLYEILDLFHKTGDVAQQAEAVESYLKMQKKFDGTRLR